MYQLSQGSEGSHDVKKRASSNLSFAEKETVDTTFGLENDSRSSENEFLGLREAYLNH